MIQAILQQAQNQTIEDFTPGTLFYIYGAPMRPMSASWARIPGAIFVNADKQATGYHTWVVVPSEELAASIVESYDLMPVFESVEYQPDGFTLCADGKTLVATHKHYDACDCETCETKRWKQAEREQFARYNAT